MGAGGGYGGVFRAEGAIFTVVSQNSGWGFLHTTTILTLVSRCNAGEQVCDRCETE